GRTRFCLHNWRRISSDPWVLATASGFRIDFSSPPVQRSPPRDLVFSQEHRALVQAEIESMIRKQAISRVVVVYRHFKMEGSHLLRDTLQYQDWMARLDLKDTYFMIPIHPGDRRFLHFFW
uniref:Reverse transcriptase domain-containing protein n=1 Tax=Latimeria chalumnae TaxID=7897 RepID=H3BAM1_LATCH